MDSRLPAELWILIFQYALGNSPVWDTTLPTVMSQSCWYKGVRKTWILRSPLDIISIAQRQRTTAIKTIVSTCRMWRQVGAEFLFESVYFGDPANILRLCATLDGDRHPGQWIKRLHIARFHERLGYTMDALQLGLVSVIHHSRKLQVFIVDWPLNGAFTPVMDALCTYASHTLQTLHVHVPQENLAKLIWTLDMLPSLISIHLEFIGIQPEEPALGAASNIVLALPNLRQLSLKGFYTDFLEQTVDWNLPSLESVTLDFSTHVNDLPDTLEFLRNHGSKLTFLSINCLPEQDVRPILDFCPALDTFAFNVDWRLPLTAVLPFESSALVRRPHETITTIGLHGGHHAFGVGTRADAPVHIASFHRASNELNFAALNKRNFPKLQRIRLLSPLLLQDLEAANGPQGEFKRRWERWWIQCADQGVRLEDCTGAELGYLPQDEDEDDYTETESDFTDGTVTVSDTRTVGDPIERIRALTERVRQMTTALQYTV